MTGVYAESKTLATWLVIFVIICIEIFNPCGRLQLFCLNPYVNSWKMDVRYTCKICYGIKQKRQSIGSSAVSCLQ